MNRRDLFDRVVAALNDAALNDGLWPSTSRLIDEAVGIKGNALLVTEGPEHDARVLFAAAHYRGQRREDLELDYLENYHLWDERIPRLRRLPNNKVTHVTGLYSERELKTSRSYNEFSPRSGGRNSLNVRLRGPNGSHITWVILDPVRADWQDAQVGMIERLLPHVRSFVHIRQSLSFASALGSTFGELLEQTSLGVIYLNRRGRVAHTNDRARQLLLRQNGLWAEDGFLHAWLPADDVHLKRLVVAALPTRSGQTSGGSLLVRHPSIVPGLTLHVLPVTVRQQESGALDLGALVLIDLPERPPGINAGLVGSALGLTPAESRVAVQLAEGMTVPDIAFETRRAESSIRSHLKRIHHKLGISRRADLVRLVLAAPRHAASEHGP